MIIERDPEITRTSVVMKLEEELDDLREELDGLPKNLTEACCERRINIGDAIVSIKTALVESKAYVEVSPS